MKFNVHAYVLARVKVEDVEAETAEKATEWVRDNLIFDGRDPYVRPPARITDVEWDDATAPEHYLVDEHGDEEYKNSVWIYQDNKTHMAGNVATDILCSLAYALHDHDLVDEIMRTHREDLPVLMGLNDSLDERIEKILSE